MRIVDLILRETLEVTFLESTVVSMQKQSLKLAELKTK